MPNIVTTQQVDRWASQLEEDEYVYNGQLYALNVLFTDIASAGAQQFHMLTAAGKHTHLYASFTAGGEAFFSASIGPTAVVLSSAIGTSGYNVTKPNTSGMTVNQVTSFGLVGTTAAQWLVPGGSGGARVGGTIDTNAKIILPPSTSVLWNVQNFGTGSINAQIRIKYYEQAV